MSRNKSLAEIEADKTIGQVKMYTKELHKIEKRHKTRIVVQNHHIVYPCPEHPDQELTIRVRRGEHLCLTRLSWYTRKTVSKGLIKALKIFIAANEDRAVEV